MEKLKPKTIMNLSMNSFNSKLARRPRKLTLKSLMMKVGNPMRISTLSFMILIKAKMEQGFLAKIPKLQLPFLMMISQAICLSHANLSPF